MISQCLYNIIFIDFFFQKYLNYVLIILRIAWCYLKMIVLKLKIVLYLFFMAILRCIDITYKYYVNVIYYIFVV